MPSRELLTTCPFPQHSMESQTYQSESHPSRSSTVVNFFSKPSKNLAPCWSNPSSDCENRNVILSLFETMVFEKMSEIDYFKNCEISTYFCFVLCECGMPGISDWAAAPNTKVG